MTEPMTISIRTTTTETAMTITMPMMTLLQVIIYNNDDDNYSTLLLNGSIACGKETLTRYLRDDCFRLRDVNSVPRCTDHYF